MVWLTEGDIKALLEERKFLKNPRDFKPVLVEKIDKWEYRKELKGSNKHRFLLNIWKSKHREDKFSAGLFVKIGGDWIPLRRYNGCHTHPNKLDKTRVTGCHIHEASERYQTINMIEGHAVETRNYTTWEGALRQLLHDNNIGPKIPRGQKLFKKEDDEVKWD